MLLLQSNRKNINIISVAVIAMVAIAVRCLPWHHVYSNGKVYFYDPDSYIRIRKAISYLNGFPATSIHDYFQGYPLGTGIITPPLLEYIAAIILMPFKSNAHIAEFLQPLYAAIPPFAGALTCLLLFLFLSKIIGTAPAITGSMLMALHPFLIESTMLGRFDNEMLEVLLFSLTCFAYFKTIDGDRNSWLICSFMSILFLGLWRGALICLVLIGSDCLFRVLDTRIDKNKRIEDAAGAALMYLSSATVIALICITDAWGSRSLFSFNIISWFHVTVFFSASALFYSAMLSLKNSHNPALIIKVCAALFVLASILIASPSGDTFRQAIKVIGGGNVWVDSISQYQSSTDAAQIFKSIMAPEILLSLSALLLPFPGSLAKTGRFVKTAMLFTLALMLLRSRFDHFTVPVMAVLAAVAVHYLNGIFTRRIGTKYSVYASIILVSGAVLITTYFNRGFYSSAYANGTSGIKVVKGDVEETMEWIKNNTPVPGDAYRPWAFPDYGICARWEYGALIETLAQRPSVATNYGTEAPGMELAGRIFTESDPNSFIAEMSRNSIRYLVIDKLSDDLSIYANLAGKNERYFTDRKDHDSAGIIKVPLPTYLNLVSTRLHLMDGLETYFNGIRFGSIEGMRLVYESRNNSNFIGAFTNVKKIKVFEHVKGALVNARCNPGEEVTMEQLVESNQGRRFIYRTRKTSDRSGITSFTVLYPAKVSSNMTGSINNAVLSTKYGKIMIKPDLKDILTGATLSEVIF